MLAIVKFKIRQFIVMTDSPSLMLAKVSCYMVILDKYSLPLISHYFYLHVLIVGNTGYINVMVEWNVYVYLLCFHIPHTELEC